MHRINYAGDTVLTGTAIAEALLSYARALADRDASETLVIPTRLDDGGVGSSTFLLGPASQLVADAEESGYDELVDEQLVEQLARRTAALGSRIAAPEPHGTAPSAAVDELDLEP